MVGRLLTWDDLEPLRDIVEHGEDPRDALRAIVRLPLDEAAAEQALAVVSRLDADLARAARERLRAGPAAPARASARPTPARSSPDAQALAERIRTRLLGAGPFPGSLNALRALAAEDARALLSALVALLLGAADQGEGVLRTATERLSQVVEALGSAQQGAIAAELPSGLQLPIGEARWTWAGGLLTLVEPADLLLAACARLDQATEVERRTVLRQLASAAPRIGRPRLPLPGPNERDEALLRLYALVGPAIAGPPPTRVRLRAAEREAPDGTPTRTAYARLDAPGRVDPGEAFELRVGLASSPTPGVTQPASGMRVPRGAFILTVQLMADGFQVLGDRSLVRELRVAPDDPFPYEVLRLRALDDPAWSPQRVITAVFLRDGGVLGTAWRTVRVGPAGQAEDRPSGDDAPGDDWVLAVGPRPDLEIIIASGNDATGRKASWYCRSPHNVAAMNVAPVAGELGEDVAEDVRNLFRLVENEKGAEGQREFVGGIGMQVGEAVPRAIWTALRAAAAVSAIPTVLLGTADPHVPWELAISPDRGDSPEFLSARTVIGRWMYREQVRSPSPPVRIDARSMAVVWGEYARQSIPEAEREGAALERWCGARRVPAEIRDVLDCIKGSPPAEIVHFAVHGRFDHTETHNGILMQDERTYLRPSSVHGALRDLRAAGATTPVRMVFLNACQVGRAGSVFGQHSGMAPALVRLGVGAVVAPLWMVDDAVAREVGTGFYQAVLQPAGASPAEFLRAERARAAGSEGTAEGDRLAYVLYGHPLLRIHWTGERDDAA